MKTLIVILLSIIVLSLTWPFLLAAFIAMLAFGYWLFQSGALQFIAVFIGIVFAGALIVGFGVKGFLALGPKG